MYKSAERAHPRALEKLTKEDNEFPSTRNPLLGKKEKKQQQQHYPNP